VSLAHLTNLHVGQNDRRGAKGIALSYILKSAFDESRKKSRESLNNPVVGRWASRFGFAQQISYQRSRSRREYRSWRWLAS
jgi:hypothetical protein